MIIDAHSHGANGKYLDKIDALGGDWIKKVLNREYKRAKETPGYFDVALRVEQLNKYGIDFQVVTPGVPFGADFCPGDITNKLAYAKAFNDNMASLMEDSKGKLIAIGTIPITGFGEKTTQEMERAIGLGLKGFSLSTNLEGTPLDLPQFEPFWAQVAKMDIVIYTHPLSPINDCPRRAYEFDYYLSHNFGYAFETALMLSRLVFSGIIERHPTLKIVNHHLGGSIPFFWGRTLESYREESQPKHLGRKMPKPLYDYFSRFYYDTAVGGSAPAIRCAYEVFGADQLVFATDTPENDEWRLATYPGVIRSLGLPEAVTEKIFSGNIKRVLKLT